MSTHKLINPLSTLIVNTVLELARQGTPNVTTVDEFVGDEFLWADGRCKPITERTAYRRALPHITDFVARIANTF